MPSNFKNSTIKIDNEEMMSGEALFTDDLPSEGFLWCRPLRSNICCGRIRKINIPKDFEFLRERIYSRLHVLVSRTTLMRFWGYVDEGVTPRKTTLDILTQFLGYQDWDNYCQNALLPKEQQSSPVLSRRLSVAKTLVRCEWLRLI